MVNPVAIANIVLTYPNWCAARIHPLLQTFFMASKMYCPFLYIISPRILTRTSTCCRPVKFTNFECVSGISYPLMALWVICIGDR